MERIGKELAREIIKIMSPGADENKVLNLMMILESKGFIKKSALENARDYYDQCIQEDFNNIGRGHLSALQGLYEIAITEQSHDR